MSVSEARLFDEGNGDRLVAIATVNHGSMTPAFEPFLASMNVGASRPFSVPHHPVDRTRRAVWKRRLRIDVLLDRDQRCHGSGSPRRSPEIVRRSDLGRALDLETRRRIPEKALVAKDLASRFSAPERLPMLLERTIETIWDAPNERSPRRHGFPGPGTAFVHPLVGNMIPRRTRERGYNAGHRKI